MNIAQARRETGFEKCDFDTYDQGKCEGCKSTLNRSNSENYRRDTFEYDEGEYACNKCVINEAKNQHLKYQGWGDAD